MGQLVHWSNMKVILSILVSAAVASCHRGHHGSWSRQYSDHKPDCPYLRHHFGSHGQREMNPPLSGGYRDTEDDPHGYRDSDYDHHDHRYGPHHHGHRGRPPFFDHSHDEHKSTGSPSYWDIFNSRHPSRQRGFKSSDEETVRAFFQEAATTSDISTASDQEVTTALNNDSEAEFETTTIGTEQERITMINTATDVLDQTTISSTNEDLTASVKSVFNEESTISSSDNLNKNEEITTTKFDSNGEITTIQPVDEEATSAQSVNADLSPISFIIDNSIEIIETPSSDDSNSNDDLTIFATLTDILNEDSTITASFNEDSSEALDGSGDEQTEITTAGSSKEKPSPNTTRSPQEELPKK